MTDASNDTENGPKEGILSIDESKSCIDDKNMQTSHLTKNNIQIDAGMMEVSIALAGIAIAIATFIPSVSSVPDIFRLLIAVIAGTLAIFSAYSSLWMFACFCTGIRTSLGFREIYTVLRYPNIFRPYWFMSQALALWFIMSTLIGVIVMLRRGLLQKAWKKVAFVFTQMTKN